MKDFLDVVSRFKNGITNGAGTIIGSDEVLEGISQVSQGNKHGWFQILKGVLTFVAFYFIGK